MNQPINVDGTVTECVITLHFSPSPTPSSNQSTSEAPDGKLLLRINDAAARLSLSAKLFCLITVVNQAHPGDA